MAGCPRPRVPLREAATVFSGAAARLLSYSQRSTVRTSSQPALWSVVPSQAGARSDLLKQSPVSHVSVTAQLRNPQLQVDVQVCRVTAAEAFLVPRVHVRRCYRASQCLLHDPCSRSPGITISHGMTRIHCGNVALEKRSGKLSRRD